MFNQYRDSSGPCPKDCPNRAMGCHSKCLKYFTWKIEHEARRKEQSGQKQADADISDFNHWSKMKHRNEAYRKSKRQRR